MFLTTLLGPTTERHGSIENPNVPITGPNLTAQDVWGGWNQSDSGIEVNSSTVLKNSSPVWAGVNVISSGVAKLPCSKFRVSGDVKEVDRTSPAHRRIHLRPNRLMGPSNFKWLMQARALIYGTAYAEIDRGDGNRLIPLPITTKQVVAPNGDLWLVVEDRNAKIPAIDALIIRGPSPDGLMGYALSEIGKNSIGLNMALIKFANKFFANGGGKKLVLRHPGHLDEQDARRLRESWERLQTGLDNSHRTAVLEEGMEVSDIGTTPEDAMVIQSLNWTVQDVARLLNVQPHKLADQSNSTYNNQTESNKQFLEDTLDPWLTIWEEELNHKLLTEREKSGGQSFFKFNPAKLLRMNFRDQAETLTQACGGPFMTRNQARDILDMNPIDGFDEPLVPMSNNVPADQIPDADQSESEVETESAADDSRLVEFLGINSRDAIRRMAKRLAVHSIRVARREDVNFIDWLEMGLLADHRHQVQDALSASTSLVAIQCGDDPAELTSELVRRLFDTVRGELFDATELPREDFVPRVEAIASTWEARLPQQLGDELLQGAIKC